MAKKGFGAFDFSGIKLDKLSFESFTGSAENARPFRFFEQLGDVSALAESFSGEAGKIGQGVRQQLTETVAELEQTRELTAKLYEARIKTLNDDLEIVNGRLDEARDVPRLERHAGRFQVAVKVRDEASGAGLTGLVAEAFVRRDKQEQIVERQTTDGAGNFTMSFERGAVPDRHDLFVRFYTAGGQPVPEVELCFPVKWGRVSLTTVDLDAPELLAAAVDAARGLAAQRNARRAGLNDKIRDVQGEQEAAVRHIDAEIERCRDWLARLERTSDTAA